MLANTPILFVAHACYLDDSNGAAVASRAMMEALSRRGRAVEVLCGIVLDLGREVDPVHWLVARGHDVDRAGRDHLRLTVRGVPITLHLGPTTKPHDPEDIEREEFLRLFEATLARIQPGVVAAYGGSRLVREVLATARSRGIATVFPLHNLCYHDPRPFADADAVIVPSRFAADYYYRDSLGLSCTVLSNLVDRERIRAERTGPGYVTFVNPSPEKGVYVFARIADELARLRPDIPVLVVEGRGTEATLAVCGLDLRVHGTVSHLSRYCRVYCRWLLHTLSARQRRDLLARLAGTRSGTVICLEFRDPADAVGLTPVTNDPRLFFDDGHFRWLVSADEVLAALGPGFEVMFRALGQFSPTPASDLVLARLIVRKL